MNFKTCCFTGNRPQKLTCGFDERHRECKRIKKALSKGIKKAIKQGFTCFISGGALGVDTWAAEEVLALKKQYPLVTLEIAVPCLGQEAKWRKDDKQRYQSILEQADEVTVLEQYYTADCMNKRNEYMVNKASYVIAVWNGRRGGTASTIKYARMQERSVDVIETD